MRKETVDYWDAKAARSDTTARDVVLRGFGAEEAFDETGREDSRHLVLPFISPQSVVLDVGCGLGRLLKWAAPACKEAIGLDVSVEMLNKAKIRLKGLENVRLKRLPLSLRFPVRPQTIDFAYFYHVSEQIEREDSFTMLTEIRRCLRARGAALVQFSLLEYSANQRVFRNRQRKDEIHAVRRRFYTEPEVLAMLAMARLYPQIRLYIPGEFAVVVTKRDGRAQGNMPLVSLVQESAHIPPLAPPQPAEKIQWPST